MIHACAFLKRKLLGMQVLHVIPWGVRSVKKAKLEGSLPKEPGTSMHTAHLAFLVAEDSCRPLEGHVDKATSKILCLM